MRPVQLRKYKLLRSHITSFIAGGRVTTAHTDNLHIYIDSFSGGQYSESASKIISILNTEGYAQKNARTIIKDIKNTYPQFTDETIEQQLCEILHVSSDKLEATGLGNEVHRLLDLYNKMIINHIDRYNGIPYYSPDEIKTWAEKNSPEGMVDIRVLASLMAYENFRASHNVIPLASELAVVSTVYQTGGTIDLLCLMNDKITLIDYKTGELKAEHWMQQVLYKKMIEECLHISVRKIYLWKPTMKDIRFKLEEVGSFTKVNSILQSCIKSHHYLTQLKELRRKV